MNACNRFARSVFHEYDKYYSKRLYVYINYRCYNMIGLTYLEGLMLIKPKSPVGVLFAITITFLK